MLSEISQAVRDKYHMISDADPGQQDPLWLLYSNTHTHRLQKSCGEKGAAWLLSKLERDPFTPAWTGFYCLSRHITSRMVLIYCAQVCFGWLSFADEGEDVAEYIKEGYLQCEGRSGRNLLCSIPGRSSSDFRKITILGKHLLPQFRVREF